MIDMDPHLEDKQAQINKWIGILARLDVLCREAGEEVWIKSEFYISEFRQNLQELNLMFRKFQELNDYSREKFNKVVEENWNKLEESFEQSVSEYEHQCKAWIEG